MRIIAICLAIAALASPASAREDAAAGAATFNPRAGELFDLDPVLKQWAVRIYDRNHDGWLTLYEAQPAAAAFRDIADADRNGRVTVREYENAVGFIRARY